MYSLINIGKNKYGSVRVKCRLVVVFFFCLCGEFNY